MSKNTLEQVKELLKHIQENPEAFKKLEELAKSVKKDPQAQPIFSEKIIKPSDKDAVVLNPNVKKPLANAEDSKQVEMEMSPQDHEKKRVGELAKRIKACIEKMQMDKIQKESMDKDDQPHAPNTAEDKAHDVAEEGESVKEALEGLKDKSEDSKKEMLSHLRSLKDKSQLRSPENRKVGKESHEKAELEKARESQPADEDAAHELHLFSTNDSGLYHGSAKPIIENLARKHAKGQYDHEKATKIWEYHADRAAKEYNKQLGGDQHTFNPSTRKAAAKKMRDYYHEDVEGRSKELSKPKTKKAELQKEDDKNLKGIHQAHFGASNKSGTSQVGAWMIPGVKPSKTIKRYAKDTHEKILSELRAMKKPNLPKTEKAELEKSVHGVPGKNRPLHSRGVNEPVSVSTPEFAQDAKEKSLMGLKVRRKDISGAKDAVKEIISELRAMKKPNLPKAELQKQLMSPPFSMTEKSEGYYRDLVKRCWEGYEPTPGKKPYSKGSCRPVKKEETGVHGTGIDYKGKKTQGKSFAGNRLRDSFKYGKDMQSSKELAAKDAKDLHRKKLAQLLSMKKPNLPKSELEKEQMIPVPKPKLPMPIISGSDNGDSKKPKKPIKKPLMNSELEKEDLQAIPKKVLVEEMSGDPKEKGSLKQHSYWKTPGKEGSYPRTRFNAAASDKMRLVDMMTGKYKMHGPKGVLKSEKTEYYEGLIKSVLEKAKIIAGPGRQEKPGTVLGESKTKNLKFKDYEKEQKSIDLFNQSRNNPTKENIQAFHESQKIDLKEKPKKKTTKAPSAKSVKKTEGLEKKQKVLIHGRVKYVDVTPDAPHEVLAYNIKQSAKGRKKRKPKKTQVRKSEQYYQDLIKKVLDN